MGLIQVAIKIEEGCWKGLPFNERSKIIRDLVSNYLAYQDKDMENIDEQILLRKKQTLETKKIQVDTELESIKSTLNMLMEKREKAEGTRLIDEKERIDSAKCCLSCGRILEEAHKKVEFPKGMVCHSCFLMSSKEDMDKWKE